MDQADSLVKETLASNATRVFTSEAGIASAALFFMAVIPIYIGAHKSIKAVKESLKPEATEISVIQPNEVAMFPVYASCALFTIFLVFKLIAAEYINMLISVYFFIIGTHTVFCLIRPFAKCLFPSRIPNKRFKLILNETANDETPFKEVFKLEFERSDSIPLLIASGIGLIYISTKHWFVNNIISISIAIMGIEYLHLDRVINGCILLCGLFIYDIFWVFGTNVMVFVATTFDGPIKVVFPREILTNGFFSKDVGMLGLGDIVIPGIFLALLLRFDDKRNQNGSRLYFYTGFVAYIIGLITTFVFMYVFRHAQPALLYLVPTCLGFPLTMALIRGDFNDLMAYKDIPKEVEERSKANQNASTKKQS